MRRITSVSDAAFLRATGEAKKKEFMSYLGGDACRLPDYGPTRKSELRCTYFEPWSFEVLGLNTTRTRQWRREASGETSRPRHKRAAARACTSTTMPCSDENNTACVATSAYAADSETPNQYSPVGTGGCGGSSKTPSRMSRCSSTQNTSHVD